MLNQSLYKIILGGLFALLVVTTIWAIRGSRKTAPRHRSGETPLPEGDPMLYLQELHARGEISKDEYEARKKRLAV
ncbi:MAG: SHOCT domain-containing protein [Nitrospira sp.]|nr:SHOCT domain-containing protein [Candidatus Manganitrophaceae bacterium]